MENLKKLQNQFIDAIYDQKNSEIFDEIKTGKASKEQLIDIYRNNMRVTLSNVLRITYPTILQKIGAEKFEEFAADFIAKHRSQSNNLDEFGAEFADFFSEKKEEFLQDLSQLDWLKQQSYLAPDLAPLDILALQNLAPENLFNIKFKLDPACFLLTSNYNLLSQNKTERKENRKIYFVIFRQNLAVQAEKISKSEFIFLSGVRDGLTLFEIYEKYQIDIQNCLQKYVAAGILKDFTV